GADAIVLGYPLDGPFDAQEARVRELRDISGPDIYGSRQVSREVYSIRALVRSGNSGGPLVDPSGEVLGVIFAAAADDPNTGFALSAQKVEEAAEAGAGRTRVTGTGCCAWAARRWPRAAARRRRRAGPRLAPSRPPSSRAPRRPARRGRGKVPGRTAGAAVDRVRRSA